MQLKLCRYEESFRFSELTYSRSNYFFNVEAAENSHYVTVFCYSIHYSIREQIALLRYKSNIIKLYYSIESILLFLALGTHPVK